MVHVSSLFRPQGTVASTASCLQLHKRAERVAAALMGRLNTGDHVALVYPPGMMERCHFKFSTFQIGVFVRIARVAKLSGLNIIVCFAGVDLIATFYGCLYAGCVPVTVRPPHPQNLATTLPTVKMIVEVTFSVGFALLCMRVRGCVSYNSWCVVFTFKIFAIFALKVSKSVCILTTQAIMKLLRSKEAAAAVDIKSWPMVLDTGEVPA